MSNRLLSYCQSSIFACAYSRVFNIFFQMQIKLMTTFASPRTRRTNKKKLLPSKTNLLMSNSEKKHKEPQIFPLRYPIVNRNYVSMRIETAWKMHYSPGTKNEKTQQRGEPKQNSIHVLNCVFQCNVIIIDLYILNGKLQWEAGARHTLNVLDAILRKWIVKYFLYIRYYWKMLRREPNLLLLREASFFLGYRCTQFTCSIRLDSLPHQFLLTHSKLNWILFEFQYTWLACVFFRFLNEKLSADNSVVDVMARRMCD